MGYGDLGLTLRLGRGPFPLSEQRIPSLMSSLSFLTIFFGSVNLLPSHFHPSCLEILQKEEGKAEEALGCSVLGLMEHMTLKK